MRLTQMTRMVGVVALVAAMAACGTDEEPTVTEPTAEAPATAEPTTTPTTEIPTTEAATTSESTTQPAPPEASLPTSATAYSDAFVTAWSTDDRATMERLASADALYSLSAWTPWGGATWHYASDEPVDGAGISGTAVHYRTDDNQLLTINLDNAVVEAGGEQAIIGAAYSLGDYPIPTTVEAYAQEFLSAVGTGDTEFALQLGPADGFAGAELWADLTYGMVTVSDLGNGTSLVEVPFEEGGRLELTIDEATVAAQGEHAILSVVFHE